MTEVGQYDHNIFYVYGRNLIKCVVVDGSTFVSLNARGFLSFDSHSADQEIILLFGTRSSPFIQNTTIDLIVNHVIQVTQLSLSRLYLQLSPST